jgi:hypothetical protein
MKAASLVGKINNYQSKRSHARWPYLPECKTTLRWPPQIKLSAKGKCIYPNLRWPPTNKMSAKKKYFTINFIHLIHKACQILFYLHLPISVTVSIFTVSAFIFLALLTSPSSSLPFQSHPLHWTNSKFLKLFTVTSGEMLCHAVMIHIDNIIHLYFLVYELIWTHEEDSQFSPLMVLVALRMLNVLWMFVLCLWSDQSEFMALCMVFNLWISPGFIFESCS